MKNKKIIINKIRCLFLLALMFIFTTAVKTVNLTSYLCQNNCKNVYYIVSENDNLWNIVDNYQYNYEKRDYIDKIIKLNNIDNQLKPGDIILIPDVLN
ncbi:MULTISPECIES: LysM peptidoglycan-binding domain-containing protein [Peptoniphilus]|uniref:LysM peptidoglycan-binding domain-containing protein n=1 Tax=Peptoniphilus TaxID=162289 RepID=UPI0001DAA4C9|nr:MULTISPECIES: LysM peptidoglycan-binding domain-containing protein [Peptoniphilus]EFI41295.1 LysM domain protein [Peptoniphilus sp. oral taxon 386 str. F0131]